MKKLTVFSPFSNIWEHTFPEALIMSGLRNIGWDIDFLRCGGTLSTHCVAMSAAGVGEFDDERRKQKVCSACIRRRNLVSREFSFTTSLIESYLTLENEHQISRILNNVTISNWHELVIDEVPLGRFATYEMWLNRKIPDEKLPNELWDLYLGQLENTLKVFFSTKNFFSSHKPDAVLVYNSHYSVNHVFTAVAEKNSIPAYSIHGGMHMLRRAESMSIARAGFIMSEIIASSAWERYSQKPISAANVNDVASHFQGLWDANSAFAYSSSLAGTDASSLRSKFGISPEKKVLLATMSSEDELLGLQLIGISPSVRGAKSLFKDQFDWVHHLLKYARENPEVHLILRLHPRMFPNKREQQLSPVVASILELKNEASSNVTFNVPDDDVSLYDLVQIIDVLLNFRSTVGVELLALGIPVVIPSNSEFYTYPTSLNFVGRSRPEYSRMIDKAIQQGWSLENSRMAFRWMSFVFNRVAASFSDEYVSRPTKLRPKRPGLLLAIWKVLVFIVLQYGPLIREKATIRGASISPRFIDLFNDVLSNKLNILSDSVEWTDESNSKQAETKALLDFFRHVESARWQNVTDSNSLASRVRNYLESRDVRDEF